MNGQIIIRCEISSMLRIHSKGWRSKRSLKAARDERDRLAVEVKSDTDPVQRKASEKFKVEGDQVKAHTSRLARAGRGLFGTTSTARPASLLGVAAGMVCAVDLGLHCGGPTRQACLVRCRSSSGTKQSCAPCGARRTRAGPC